MMTVTMDTTDINVNEAREWVDELQMVCANLEIKDVNISGNKISFEAGISGMEDTEPVDISTRINEYLTTNEAFENLQTYL